MNATGVTTGHPSAGADDEMNAALLRIAFPDFWFSQLTHRRHLPRWVAMCQHDTGIGLYAVVTCDLTALTAVLTLDRAWRASHGEPGATPLPAPPGWRSLDLRTIASGRSSVG